MSAKTAAQSRATRQSIASRIGTLGGILLVWFSLMILSARFLPVTAQYLVIGPELRIIDDLPPDARIMRTGNRTIVVNMSGPNAGRQLYAAGAWLVFPALANGCLALRSG